MLSKLRASIKSFIGIVAYPFAALKINPNLFSFFAIPLCLISAYFISIQNFYLAFWFGLFAISIDLFDGAVARLQNASTLFGNYFETMVDKVVEIVLFIGCATIHPLAAVCALGFSMLVSYAKPRASLVIITDNRDWPGIGEHSERMGLLLLGFLLSIFGFSINGPPILEIILWLIAAITFVGSIQRIFYCRSLINEAEQNGTVLPYLKKK
ncbi:MAG TPA: CDP-alcohol phosphatidyltransferase family protein [archaeon]|nr:CDP-alcohol phosphatidyltransferase family protein [archaeon]